jgi:hypothetical protein
VVAQLQTTVTASLAGARAGQSSGQRSSPRRMLPNFPDFAIIRQEKPSEQILLYHINRGHRLIPADHCAMQYLDHLVGVAMEECGVH